MSRFTNAQNWCERSSGDAYFTTAPLVWEIGTVGSGLFLIVPARTVFDVSVPKWLRWIVSAHDPRMLKAAALHDHALSLGWDRVAAAAVFHGGLQAQGVQRLARLVLTLVVIIWRWQ